ncbi:MAG: rod shape-determining protein MreC [Clostridia bacterium]|nr:rod shape-determining protein MreC [Clostridia bacterium]
MYKSSKGNKGGKLGIIITAIILIVLVICTNLNRNIIDIIVNPFTKITMSIQGGFAYLGNKIKGNDEYFTSLDSMKKQYDDLKKENERLVSENQKLVALQAENKTLKEQIGISEKYPEWEVVPAYVIQKDFSNYSKIIVINVGKKDGVENDMTVVTDSGLVGYVVSAEDKSSKVQTIVDTASAVSCFISNSDKSMVTRGILDSNKKIKGTYIDNDVVINEGDTIYTSGIGGIYPKNITVGKVKEIENTQNKTNRYVYVETAVDFDKISSVVVIKNQK